MSRRISNSETLNEYGVIGRSDDGGVTITEPSHLWIVDALKLAFRPDRIEPAERAATLPARPKAAKRQRSISKLFETGEAA